MYIDYRISQSSTMVFDILTMMSMQAQYRQAVRTVVAFGEILSYVGVPHDLTHFNGTFGNKLSIDVA